MRLPVDQVVDLQQIETLAAQELERALHLGDARRAARRPHLRSDPECVPYAELGGEVADGRLGRAVHRRGIDHATTELDEAPQHLALRPAIPRIADVECLPRAEADGRNRLPA